MYTSYIGKKFLNYYNEKEGTNYSAKEFFNEVMFPLFFNDEKHLLHVGNSSFFQSVPKNIKEENVNRFKLERFHIDVKNEVPNMATYVGFAAKDVKGTTSGQLTDIEFKIDSEEMYSSWIGQSLGIGVSSGFIIAIDNAEVLFNIFKGAEFYREYLSKTPKVKDKQIETWNGHWLVHFYSNDYKDEDIWYNFEIETKSTNNIISIPTIQWTRIVFTFTKIFPNSEIIVYAYNLSQTNTTLGFIKIYVPQIKRLFELRDKIFVDKEKSIITDKQIELFEPFYSFKLACKLGTIGLKSIEPKGLRKFLPSGSYKYSQGKELKVSENNYLTFLLYKLWVIAMLNRTELQALAEKLAKALLGNKTENKTNNRGKTIGKQEVKNLLESRNVKYFIENLTEIMINQNRNMELFKEIVKEVLKMPVDNFPLFVTLIKFEYNYQKSLEK